MARNVLLFWFEDKKMTIRAVCGLPFFFGATTLGIMTFTIITLYVMTLRIEI